MSPDGMDELFRQMLRHILWGIVGSAAGLFAILVIRGW